MDTSSMNDRHSTFCGAVMVESVAKGRESSARLRLRGSHLSKIEILSIGDDRKGWSVVLKAALTGLHSSEHRSENEPAPMQDAEAEQ